MLVPVVRGLSILLLCLQFHVLESQTHYYLKSGSSNPRIASSWNTAIDGTGTDAASFLGANIWHFTNRTSETIVNKFNLMLVTSTFVIESGINVILSTNGKLGGAATNPPTNISSGGTITCQGG